MVKIKTFLTAFALLIATASFAVDNDDKEKSSTSTPFSASFEGKFLYKGYEASEISIVITDATHTESYNNGEFKVVSKLSWVAENKMMLEIVENTLPESNFKVGDEMSIEIERSKDNKYFYKSTLNEVSWKGCMIKVE